MINKVINEQKLDLKQTCKYIHNKLVRTYFKINTKQRNKWKKQIKMNKSNEMKSKGSADKINRHIGGQHINRHREKELRVRELNSQTHTNRE